MVRGSLRDGVKRLVALLLLSGACAESVPGVPPPERQLHYPIGLLTLGEGADEYLVAVSSNFDQRYNAGRITSFSLEALFALSEGVPDGEVRFLDGFGDGGTDAFLGTVRVPSFGGDLVYTPTAGGAEGRLFLALRGRNELLMVSFARGSLSCGNTTAGGAAIETPKTVDCTPAHTIETSFDDPFALAVAPPVPGGAPEGLVAVGHLRFQQSSGVIFGSLGLVDIAGFSRRIEEERGVDGVKTEPRLTLNFTDLGGTTGIVFLPPPAFASDHGTFVTSARSVAPNLTLDAFPIRFAEDEGGRFVTISREATLRLDAVASAFETRGLAVSRESGRVFVSVRFREQGDGSNAGIAVVSTEGGFKLLSVLEIGEELSRPALLERADGARLLYVPDTRTDRVFIVDVRSDAPILAGIVEGISSRDFEGERVQVRALAAPAQVAFATRAGRTLAFVTNFANSTLAVIDASDPDPRRHRVVARLGRDIDTTGEREGP